MRTIAVWLSVLAAGFCWTVAIHPVEAALTSAQKKELSQIRRKLTKAASIIRRKKFDEAEKMINDAEARWKKIAAAAKLPPNSKLVTGIRKSISQKRQALAIRKDPKKARQQQSVSFMKHVAPLLNARCVKCHSDDPGGKLHLDTFAGMKKGGKTGPLLVIGSAKGSLIMYRLLSPDDKQRMPKNGPPLSRTELSILALWINQGAKFDGKDEEKELSELLKPPKKLPPVKFAKATGDEKVSFKRDIAPFMVTYCLRCHGGGKKLEGGLSLANFESLMRGGKRGPILVPGQPEQSRVYQLMGSFDESKRMPANRSKVTRKNYDDLKTWIAEGAKYDGGDPKLGLRALNPTAADMQAAELATLTPEQFVSFRESRTAEQWKQAFPDEEPRSLKSKEVYVFGNVSAERLEEVKKWGEEHLETLRKLFAVGEEKLIWKGKLTIFVFKDRSGYETFNEVVTQRKVFGETVGNFKVTETFADAYLALQDVGDRSGAEAPALQFNLIDQLTGAYLATSEGSYPEWLTLGLGPALAAAKAGRKDEYVEQLRGAAIESLKDLEKPADVFMDGTFFSSDQTRPVGFTLAAFMLKKGGEKKFAKFIKTLQEGGEVGNSIRVVYGADPEPIARSYFSTFKVRRKRKR